MHKPEDHGSHPDKANIDTSVGYEQSDVKITGILVFLIALGTFVAVSGVLCYGIGKVINAELNREDGPTTKWSKTVNIRQLGNMPNNPEMQNKVAELTQQFPTPRVQLDDGNQDVADLHARENLLLNNYTWVDAEHTRVRIPIERAMELMAQHGLPVAPAPQLQAHMTGDGHPVIHAPLTDGFAPTAFEQQQAQADAIEAHEKEESK
jgi:hypothetical protein